MVKFSNRTAFLHAKDWSCTGRGSGCKTKRQERSGPAVRQAVHWGSGLFLGDSHIKTWFNDVKCLEEGLVSGHVKYVKLLLSQNSREHVQESLIFL